MELYRSASLQSQFRGYDYFKDKKIISFKHKENSIYCGKVKGSDKVYDVEIDTYHYYRDTDSLITNLFNRVNEVSNSFKCLFPDQNYNTQ